MRCSGFMVFLSFGRSFDDQEKTRLSLKWSGIDMSCALLKPSYGDRNDELSVFVLPAVSIRSRVER